MADTPAAPAVAPHGSHRLPAVDVATAITLNSKTMKGLSAIAPAKARFAT